MAGFDGADDTQSQGNQGNSATLFRYGHPLAKALTFMATLAMLERQGVLHRYETDLERDEQPERLLYCTQGFLDWFEDVLPGLRGDRGALPPIEQVTQRFHDFVTGRPLVYNQGAKNLDPMVDGVWELKTHDVRIFGWFAAPSCFVAVNGALRSALVPHARFTPFIEEVTQVRNNLPLDEPKFIPGGVLRNVL